MMRRGTKRSIDGAMRHAHTSHDSNWTNDPTIIRTSKQSGKTAVSQNAKRSKLTASVRGTAKHPVGGLDRFGFPLEFKGTYEESLNLVTLMREETAQCGSASLAAMSDLLPNKQRYV